MADSWDEYAADWDDDPAARAYATAAFASLQTTLDQRGVSISGSTVCDFGCGTGLMTEQLVDEVESIDAVDTSPAMLAVLETKRARHGWSHVRIGADIPALRNGHDVVVCSSVCGFLDDYPGTAQTLAGLLRPGGVFVQWDWERDEAAADPYGLSRHEISDALAAAGLVEVSIDRAFEVTVNDETMRPLIGVGQKPGPA